MPPRKRAAPSQPSTPAKKQKQQPSLTSFFASLSRRARPEPNGDQACNRRKDARTPPSGSRKEPAETVHDDADAELTQEQRDARFAAELAAADHGISAAEFLRRIKAEQHMASRIDHQCSRNDIAVAAADPRRPELEPVEGLDMHATAPSKRDSPLPLQPVSTKSAQQDQAKVAASRPPSKPRPVDLAALDRSVQAIPLSDDIFAFDPYSVDTSTWPTAPAPAAASSSASAPASGDAPEQLPTVPYALLTYAFVQISATRSRLTITTLLTNLLRVIRAHDPASLLPSVYLISNHIAPAYDGVELGIGLSLVNKAIKQVTGKSARHLKSLWDRTGDPGDVAYEAKKDVKALVKSAPITVQKLFSKLHAIARLSGQGSASQKLGHVTKLLVASRGEETRFLGRTFISHLRIQAVRTTIATALARVFALVEEQGPQPVSSTKRQKERALQLLVHPQERRGILAHPTKPKDRTDARRLTVMDKLARAEKLVREVRARHPNFGVIVPALLAVGLPGLSDHVPLRIGTPISPMLGSITRSLDAMHEKLGPRAFVSEFKYDGQRCQIHAVYVPKSAGAEARKSIVESRNSAAANNGKCGKWAGKNGEVYVRLFSRHLEEMTEKYPDICDMIPILMGREVEDAVGRGGLLDDIDAGGMEGSQLREVADVDVDGGEGEGGGGAASPSDGGGPMQITSFIMDAEVVAMGLGGELLPFQTLANRSRKDVSLHDIKVKVGVFAFDLMYLDGESLLKSSFRVRRNLLHSRFKPLAPKSPLIARFDHVRSCESTDRDEVARFFAVAQEHKCEGIMVKSLDHHWETPVPRPAEASPDRAAGAKEADVDADADADDDGDVNGKRPRLEMLGDVIEDDLAADESLDDDDDGSGGSVNLIAGASVDGKGVNGRGKALLSTYEPDKRCESWLKVKKDYVDGLGDSLDLVPIGAWHGMGRKATWWSPILLAVYDADTGVFQAVCKCISGFTDAFYKELNVRYAEGSDTCVAARGGEPPPGGYEYETGNLVPDVWWKPSEVWELRGADITLSPNYTAALGLVSEERGLSIRFPRFIKRRDDKGPEQASSPHQLAGIYREQQRASPRAEADGGGADQGGCATGSAGKAAPVAVDLDFE
ncbi:hypothetical protein ACQY0O_002548 [Thecaphora frezii]